MTRLEYSLQEPLDVQRKKLETLNAKPPAWARRHRLLQTASRVERARIGLTPAPRSTGKSYRPGDGH